MISTVVSLWRYPVKSMMGEELNAAEITERGLAGDRAYALVDRLSGKVGTAKNPRNWPDLFYFRAVFIEPPRAGEKTPAVRVTLPDGSTYTSEQQELSAAVSRLFRRDVNLLAAAPEARYAEEYWPDMDGLPQRDTVTDFPVGSGSPAGTYFDYAPLLLLTTSTINRLRELYPEGRFEVRRFRPNIVIDPAGESGFVENGWVGRTLAIGEARVQVMIPCPRCVMTTLPQGDLPHDAGILRTAVRHNRLKIPELGELGCVGAYAQVLKPGLIRRGDPVIVE